MTIWAIEYEEIESKLPKIAFFVVKKSAYYAFSLFAFPYVKNKICKFTVLLGGKEIIYFHYIHSVYIITSCLLTEVLARYEWKIVDQKVLLGR